MPASRRNTARRQGKPTSRAIISTQLRALLTNGEQTLFAVARDSRVSLSSLTRFVSGERDLRLATLDQLADVFGLKLVETGRSKVKASRSPRPGSTRREASSDPASHSGTEILAEDALPGVSD